MSIRLTPAIPILNTREYFSTKLQVTAVKGNAILGSECCFLYPNCDWFLPAIADLTDSDDYKNDKKDFIIKVANNSTVVGTLIKIAPDGTETPTTIVDNTLGILYVLGVLKSNVWGFKLSWRLVASVLGFGKYKFNITVENSSSNETFNEDSVCWQLIPYSCQNAHRTIRIDTLQSGYFEGAFDYTDLVVPADGGNKTVSVGTHWPQQIRLWGRFFRSEWQLNVDNLVTQQRGQEMIQTQTIRGFTLLLDTIQTKISDHLIEDMLLAPEVKISDYNINNIEVYKRERVSLTDIGEPVIHTQNINEFYDIKFVEWQQDNVHRFR